MKRSRPETSEPSGVPTDGDRLRWKTLLSLVDYKPGWAFELIEVISKKGALAIRFKMIVWDTMAKNELAPLMVTTDYAVPPRLLGPRFSNSDALDYVRDCITLIELHELSEWIRFDGMQCYNPHGNPQLLGRRQEGWEWFSPPALSIAPHLQEKPHG